jgi:hypothetical protein
MRGLAAPATRRKAPAEKIAVLVAQLKRALRTLVA